MPTGNVARIIALTPTWVRDPDARDYIRRVEAADGMALEPIVKNAIYNFVVGCKIDRNWSAIKAACILAGARTLNGALVPLVGTAPTNVNFVSGDYDRKTGLVGNGTTKRLSSGLSGSAALQNNIHMTVYATALSYASGIPVGANTSANSTVIDVIASDNLKFATGINPAVAGDFYRLYHLAPITGFHGWSRASALSASVRSKSASYVATVSSTTMHSLPFFVFCRNNSGSAASFSSARLAFYSIGESLDLALLDARVSQLINTFAAVIP